MPSAPETYDAWYQTPRGRWIGETEYQLLRRQLAVRPRETILDVGCGTGYFSRRFAQDGHPVLGVDLDPAAAAYARTSMTPPLPAVAGDMTALPFPDRSFDCVISVTALCFVADEAKALREMVRVARRRVALGLLNRHSLLHWRRGKSAGYAGARWHAWAEARALLADAGIERIRSASAIFLPSGDALAQALEEGIPSSLPIGGFLALAGEAHSAGRQAP